MGSNYFKRNPDNSVTDMGRTWAPSKEEREQMQRVAKTEALDYEVSTVFLFLDHSFGDDAPPVLWETLVFGDGPFDGEMKRYYTYEEAVAGHDDMVQRIKDNAETDQHIRDLEKQARDLRYKMLGWSH